ncbi:MAG TPA: chorismate-binding protein [Polyangiaceae bacterium]
MVTVATFVADTTTPVRVYMALRRAAGDSASFLLERSLGEPGRRHSIVGYRPRHEITLQSSGHWVGARGLPHGMRPVAGARDALDAAGSLFDPGDQAGAAEHPAARFARSYVGYLAWDAVHAIDKASGSAHRGSAPLARFFGGATVVVFDAPSHTAAIAGEDPADVERARAHLERAPPPAGVAVPRRAHGPTDAELDVDDTAFAEAVRRAQKRIAAGDAREVVLSRRFAVERAGRDPFEAYRAMRALEPSPYTFFLDLPPAPGERTRTQIAGASGETLVRAEGGRAPPWDVVRAAFPAASVSGDPKGRAASVIRELESGPRGPYGGAVGHITKWGELDFASATGTLVCKDDRFVVSAGASVVAETDPADASDRAREKARGMLAAIGAATPAA